jgi:hypothetical protein
MKLPNVLAAVEAMLAVPLCNRTCNNESDLVARAGEGTAAAATLASCASPPEKQDDHSRIAP